MALEQSQSKEKHNNYCRASAGATGGPNDVHGSHGRVVAVNEAKRYENQEKL